MSLTTQRPERPVILTILAILAIIAGVLNIIIAIAALTGGGFAALGGNLANKANTTVGIELIGIGIVGLIIGILYLAFGIGALEHRHWAWVLGVLAQYITLGAALIDLIYGLFTDTLVQALSRNIINIIIAAVILYYLYTPKVREFFGQR